MTHAPATLPGEDGAGTLVVRGSQPINSQRVPPCSAREPRQSSTDCRGNSHKVARHDRLIIAEAYHDFGDDLPNQPGIIALVGVNGGVEPFHFIDFRPFHDGRTSRVRQK